MKMVRGVGPPASRRRQAAGLRTKAALSMILCGMQSGHWGVEARLRQDVEPVIAMREAFTHSDQAQI